MSPLADTHLLEHETQKIPPKKCQFETDIQCSPLLMRIQFLITYIQILFRIIVVALYTLHQLFKIKNTVQLFELELICLKVMLTFVQLTCQLNRYSDLHCFKLRFVFYSLLLAGRNSFVVEQNCVNVKNGVITNSFNLMNVNIITRRQ